MKTNISHHQHHRKIRRSRAVISTEARPTILNSERAAQRIAHRFGLTLPHAAVVARCAGLGLDQEAGR